MELRCGGFDEGPPYMHVYRMSQAETHDPLRIAVQEMAETQRRQGVLGLFQYGSMPL